MSGINPFDPERDPALGAMLRDALTGADQAGFMARVRASVALTRQERTFDVLARWLRPNVAAARRDHDAGRRALVVPGGERARHRRHRDRGGAPGIRLGPGAGNPDRRPAGGPMISSTRRAAVLLLATFVLGAAAGAGVMAYRMRTPEPPPAQGRVGVVPRPPEAQPRPHAGAAGQREGRARSLHPGHGLAHERDPAPARHGTNCDARGDRALPRPKAAEGVRRDAAEARTGAPGWRIEWPLAGLRCCCCCCPRWRRRSSPPRHW